MFRALSHIFCMKKLLAELTIIEGKIRHRAPNIVPSKLQIRNLVQNTENLKIKPKPYVMARNGLYKFSGLKNNVEDNSIEELGKKNKPDNVTAQTFFSNIGLTPSTSAMYNVARLENNLPQQCERPRTHEVDVGESKEKLPQNGKRPLVSKEVEPKVDQVEVLRESKKRSTRNKTKDMAVIEGVLPAKRKRIQKKYTDYVVGDELDDILDEAEGKSKRSRTNARSKSKCYIVNLEEELPQKNKRKGIKISPNKIPDDEEEILTPLRVATQKKYTRKRTHDGAIGVRIRPETV